MEADRHIGEAAELYAAGALDSGERATVEAHIVHCAECLRRVGEAEETVLALERDLVAEPRPGAGKVLQVERRGISPWWLAVAAAAALVAGVLIPRPVSHHDAATVAMIQSHFSHAQFSGAGPPAKVLYARNRSWYYVIVMGCHRYDVYGIARTGPTRLGTTEPNGDTSQLFTQTHAAFERLEVRDGRTVFETAAIR
ncbi:MAG: zf-HC2 domain-containing protein [Candidatus Eremiobacteraeota bacterium]|nr:zf-HC2 domain-containing protein [Candidatus Eremiobacteraeota bacterium]